MRPNGFDLAICTTGSVTQNGVVLKAGHFEGYENVDWAALLMPDNAGLTSVHVVNDGRASTWAEFVSQQDSDSLLHVVVGTGVGAGLVSQGRPLLGEHGFAGYLGHMKVAPAGDVVCSCGNKGCIETVASGPAIVRHYHDAGGDQAIGDFPAVVSAAQQGDTAAEEALEVAGTWLGLGISYAMNLLNPGLVTIGGGVVESTTSTDAGFGLYADAAIREAQAKAHRRVATATIRPGSFGNEGGMIGAALFSLFKESEN